jgi:two-component sensor histidine kinase
MDLSEVTSPTLAAILRLFAHAKITVFSQDEQLRYRWIENPPDCWAATGIAGKPETDVLPPKAAALASAAKREVLTSGRAQWTDLWVETSRGTRYFDLFVAPQREQAGRIVGVEGLCVEVTDRRAHDATMESVAREQAHRTKNLLAVIQGLGTQTARSSASTEDFIEAFRGRIQSISRSQDLSIGPKRHGAKLSHLIETQVHPYVADIGRQLAFAGEDRYLTPTGALHVGLAFYELCIAATQFGSLAAPGGKVTVSATLVDSPDGTRPPCLEVIWRECGGVNGGAIEGFAKVLLQRIVPAAVGGQAAISETDAGRSYRLTIADTEFE